MVSTSRSIILWDLCLDSSFPSAVFPIHVYFPPPFNAGLPGSISSYLLLGGHRSQISYKNTIFHLILFHHPSHPHSIPLPPSPLPSPPPSLLIDSPIESLDLLGGPIPISKLTALFVHLGVHHGSFLISIPISISIGWYCDHSNARACGAGRVLCVFPRVCSERGRACI